MEAPIAWLGPIERAALAVLIRRLGWLRSLAVGWSIQRAERRQEPFEDLPSAVDPREAASRSQAGSAILLLRALKRFLPEEEALAVTAEVVEASGAVFLGQMLGPLRRAELAALSDVERLAFLEERGGRFPNATLRWERTTAEEVQFRVTACRLVELVRHAGHPELAPTFCRADARFFGHVEPDVLLRRPTTLAAGDADCLFHLSWRTGEEL